MMLSNLFSGRSQLFFATSISHLQVHDILPHTYKLWCLAFTIPSMLKGEGNHRIPTLACNFGYYTPKSFLLPLVFPSRYLQIWICDAKMEVRSSDQLARASLVNLQREQGEKPSLSPIPIAKFALPTFHLISGSNELVLKYVI